MIDRRIEDRQVDDRQVESRREIGRWTMCLEWYKLIYILLLNPQVISAREVKLPNITR